MCHPEWHIRDGGADETADPFAKIDGPCFFGGWSELCCDFKFFTSYFKSPTGTGDVALIVKKKPQSMGGVAQDFLTVRTRVRRCGVGRGVWVPFFADAFAHRLPCSSSTPSPVAAGRLLQLRDPVQHEHEALRGAEAHRAGRPGTDHS